MVDTNYNYAKDVILRVTWLRNMQYKVNVDEVSIVVTKFLSKDSDRNDKQFYTYEIAKIKMMKETKVPKIEQKKE